MVAKKPQGFAGQVTQGFIGLMVVIIIAVAAVIPVTSDLIDSANLTGTTSTIVGLLPLLIGIALILIVVRMY